MTQENVIEDSLNKNVKTTKPKIGMFTKIKNLVIRPPKEVFVYTTQKTSIYLEHSRKIAGGTMRIEKLANANEVHFGTIYDVYAPLESGVMLVKFFEFETNKIWPIVLVDTTICKREDLPFSCMFKHV